jgi:hypothetical protein
MFGLVRSGTADTSPRLRMQKPPLIKPKKPYPERISQSVGAAGSAEDAVTAAPAACQSCGAVPHEGARFCDACGSPLMASALAAEYKQVTVLFADVVRSMDIAAALDMERLREVMTELVERSAAVARRYGGTVEYTGDGVMALFDHPAEIHAYPQAQHHPVAAPYSAAKWSVSS